MFGSLGVEYKLVGTVAAVQGFRGAGHRVISTRRLLQLQWDTGSTKRNRTASGRKLDRRAENGVCGQARRSMIDDADVRIPRASLPVDGAVCS